MMRKSNPTQGAVHEACCPFCWAPTPEADLRQVERADLKVVARLAERDPLWRRQDGACLECVQRAITETIFSSLAGQCTQERQSGECRKH